MSGDRSRSLERLEQETFDLAVIGAGIVGARVACEAATAGLRVALVDAGDFGGATSSASSKLLHGGLRYFTRGHLRLVRDAQREKRVLAARVAPHLVERGSLVVAVTRAGISNPVAAAAGLLAFWGLSGFGAPRPRVVAEREARRLAPALRAERRATYLLLEEAITDDARLTLATVAAAARAGAVVASYLRVRALEHAAGGWRLVAEGSAGEGALAIEARSVVNAAGPWVDRVRALERPGRAPLVRLSKGVHAVLPLAGPWWASVSAHAERVRNVFAVPWHGVLLLGTTDEPYEGDPASVTADDADLATLFADAATFLAPEHLRRERLLSSYAGLRALPITRDATSEAIREHVVEVSAAGLVSVAGGKLTTHRLIALDALRRLPAAVRPRIRRPSDAPLVAARPAGDPPLDPRVDPATAAHLVRLYGGEAASLNRYAALPDAFARIHPAGPDVWAQVHHAVEREWAMTEDDVLRRRTTLALRGLATAEVRRGVRDVIARSRGA